jgi:hypothetical protein
LVDLADEVLTVPAAAPFPCFDVVQHVVTENRSRPSDRSPHVRGRLRAVLDVHGPINRHH